MDNDISPQLKIRLEAIAHKRNCSLEDLLTEYADQVEYHDFPGNVYQFFELSVALICVADLNGNLLYVNPTFSHVLGYDRNTLLSQPYLSFVHPDDITATRQAMQQLKEGTNVTHFENRYRCEDGSYRWFSWASTVGPASVYAVALDVTEQKQIEQKLALSLGQNQRILDAIFDGYLEGDIHGNIQDANQIFCDMIGYTREELLNMTVFDLDPNSPQSEIKQNAQQILDEDVSIILETQHRHKDGHWIDVEINNIQIDRHRVASFIRNITERKQLENQLRRSEQYYRGIIDSQFDLVSRYTPDTTLTFVNDAYCRYFQRTRTELLGTKFLRLGPDAQHEPVLARIAEVLKNPAPDTRTFLAQDSDGKQRWIQWIDSGITDEKGQVVEIQAVGRDVTPLIETQQRLAEREEMLSTIFQNIPVMLAQFNRQGKFEYVNRHWIDVTGWTIEQMAHHNNIMAEFYPDPELRLRVLNVITTVQSGWHDFTLRTRDGSRVDTSWANVELSNGNILSIGQVITHRVELENQRVYNKQLEIELEKERELREVKERFISLISHEFRTPLAVIATSIDMIVRYFNQLSYENIQDKLTGVKYQIQRMVDLMEDTLQFSKARAGKMEFSFEDVDIFSLLQNTIDTFNMTNNGIRQITLCGDTGLVHADPRLLEHVLSNLISNALKYSDETTTVTITVTKQPDCWEFRVEDEGIGIPENDIPLLFEPFHRGKNVRDLPGTGLGLSIVKDYIELHGGEINVESAIDIGTTFIFTLPR